MIDTTSPIDIFKNSLAQDIKDSLALTVEGKTLKSHVKAKLPSDELFYSAWIGGAQFVACVGMSFGMYYFNFKVTHISMLVIESVGIAFVLQSRSHAQLKIKGASAYHLAVRLGKSPAQSSLDQMNLLDPQTWNSDCLVSITDTLQRAEETKLKDQPITRAPRQGQASPNSQQINTLIKKAKRAFSPAKWTSYATIALVAATAYVNMRALMQPSLWESCDYAYLQAPSLALVMCSLVNTVCIDMQTACTVSSIRLETTRDLLARALKGTGEQGPPLFHIDPTLEYQLFDGFRRLRISDLTTPIVE